MTKDEITYLQTYYRYLDPILRKDFLISQNKEHIEDTNIQLSQINTNIKTLEKTLADTKTQYKAEIDTLLTQSFQKHCSSLSKVYNKGSINIGFRFLGKNYSVYNQSLPNIYTLPTGTFESNYSNQFIEHHSEMKYSEEFKKLITILTLVDNNPKVRDIIVNREINKKKDELTRLYNKVLDNKLLAEQHLHILKEKTPNNKISSKILEIEKEISVHILESEKIKTRLDNLESERSNFEKIVDTNITNLRALVECTEIIQGMQVKLQEIKDQVLREITHKLRLEENISEYEKAINDLDNKIQECNNSLNIFLASNYTQPILISALANANEDDIGHHTYSHIDELRNRYNEFVAEKIDNLLD